MASTTSKTSLQYLYTYALWLGIFTVFYNLLEGIISILFGLSDDALTLFGFGVDSFIEVISGLVSLPWLCVFEVIRIL
ncbi:MAG: hypothetical protein MUP03_00610 [Anaerolineales bacterium]|nr:hypothetical protein [Anaerolineales bacterium]